MRAVAVLGVVLILFGLFALITGGFSYTKEKDKADLGPIDINVTQKEHVHLPPALGIVALVGGVLLLAMGARSRQV